MILKPFLFGLAFLLSLVSAVRAAELPVVRVELSPETVNVGQAIKLRVITLVPTWFNKPPIYPTFELANAITRMPADSSRPTSERIEGESWSGVVREYQIYPQLAARYEMTGQIVHVDYANPGSPPIEVEVAVPDLSFNAVIPAGAEALDPFLSSSQVTLEREIEPSLEELKVGDAVVVTVTARIQGMPALFLPPLTAGTNQAGLAVYPKEPQLKDGSPSIRTETVTYVFQGGGEFNLPAIELGWWNEKTKRIESAALPSVLVSVSGPPFVDAESSSNATSGRVWIFQVTLAVLVALGSVIAIRRLLPILKTLHKKRRQARLESERYAFGQLEQAVREGSMLEIDRKLLNWAERLNSGTSLRVVAERARAGDLLLELSKMTRNRYGPESDLGQPIDVETRETLRSALLECRTGYLRWRAERTARSALPPLNPRVVR